MTHHPIYFNSAVANQPPLAILDEVPEYTHIGEMLIIKGNASYDPEGEPVTYQWSLLRRPAESLAQLYIPDSDEDHVVLVPDVKGVYEIQLIVNDGMLNSEPASVVTVARQLDVPHGQAYEPDISWLWNFLRNWSAMVDDRERLSIYWSACMQVVSEVLLRLYELNLSKSIKTIPELVQRRWWPLKTRIDLPEGSLIQFNSLKSGTDGFSSEDVDDSSAVRLEKFVSLTPGRVIYFKGYGRTLLSASTKKDYTDDTGTLRTGARVALNEDIPGKLPHALWWVPTGTIVPSDDNAYLQRCTTGDLLAVEMSWGGTSTFVYWRVVCVSPDGKIGFELTPEAWSPSYSYYSGTSYKSEVTTPLGQALYDLGMDPGNFDFTQLAAALLDLLLAGQVSQVERDFGVTFTPRYVLRLSQFALPADTIAVPVLQSSTRNPVYLLRQNEDYLIRQEGDVVYAQLGDHILLDESQLPKALWAEVLYLSNAPLIEDNFGILVGAERDKLPDNITTWDKYKAVVTGLMYCFAMGPTPDNLRLGVHIVLGLPFTAERSIIRLVQSDYSDTEGLLLLEDVMGDNDDPTGNYRTYFYPLTASLETNPDEDREIQVGDVLPQFFPLCTGVLIQDWVNDADWWVPLFDGHVQIPRYHDAFFNEHWYPEEGRAWPAAAMSPFQEPQKIHYFQCAMNTQVFDMANIQCAFRFLRGILQTWRWGQEKKGIKPHYTDAILMATMSVEDQITVRDRVRCTGTFVAVDDTTGYETVLRNAHYNGFSDLLNYHNAPFHASRNHRVLTGHFESPVPSIQGVIRLDVDRSSVATFDVGHVIQGVDPWNEAIIVGMALATGQPNVPITDVLYVVYSAIGAGNPPRLFDQYDLITDTTSGATATIMNETPILFVVDEPMWDGLTDDSYHVPRFRDMLYVQGNGRHTGRYGIFRVDPTDNTRLILYQVREDDPTSNPPTPRGISPPYPHPVVAAAPSHLGSSSYRPQILDEWDALQNDSTTYYAQIERPFHNPIHAPELYLQDPDKSLLGIPAGGGGFYACALIQHIHQDNFRAGHILEIREPTLPNHLDHFEITRETDGTNEEQILAADLAMWEKSSGAPGLRTYGPAVAAPNAHHFEIYDPRLPYPKYLEGLTLPAQVGVTEYEVLLPDPPASNTDDFYRGMYLRVLSGAGAWDGTIGTLGHFFIKSYDGTTKVATVHRSHRSVLNATSVIEIVSFKAADLAAQISPIRRLYPADLLQHTLIGAVKSGSPLAAPFCRVVMVAGSATVTGVNMAGILPAGADFVTPNPVLAPWELGVVQAGDYLFLRVPAGASDDTKRLALTRYLVTGGIAAAQFDVSPTPIYNTPVGGLYFDIIRASPVTWRVNNPAIPTFMLGSPILFTPVPEWSIW